MNAGQVFVPFPTDLQPVRLVRRRNRFVVEAHRDTQRDAEVDHVVDDEARVTALHLPNSGRMTELLRPGALGLAQIDRESGRKTAGTLLLVKYEGRWVSVDARMPNRLLSRCLEMDALPPFRGYSSWKAEVSWGKSRVDFMLTSPDKPEFLVETKSCNLVEDGLALFPDAPTARGTRHLKELAEAVAMGYRAAVVWFVQRDDARAFAPHGKADPDFAQALREARARGVEAYAYRCLVEPKGVTVLGEVPIEG